LRNRWVIFSQQRPQIFPNGNAPRCEFAFGIAFADYKFCSNVSFFIVDIDTAKGAAFVDTASCVEADSKKAAIAKSRQPFVK